MAERTIFLKKRPIRKEGIAAGAITPGMLVKLGTAGTFTAHGTAGGLAPKAFAFEKELWDGTNVDTPYANGDRLLYGVCDPGAEVYALVGAAAAAIVRGDYLESAGNGMLRKLASGVALAMALEAVDNSGGASPARIIVEVL